MSEDKTQVAKLGIDMKKFRPGSIRLNRLERKIEQHLEKKGRIICEGEFESGGELEKPDRTGFINRTKVYHVRDASVTVWEYDQRGVETPDNERTSTYVVAIYSRSMQDVTDLSAELQALDPRGRLSPIESDAESYII